MGYYWILHRPESYWESLSCKIHYVKHKWVETKIWNNVFYDVRNKLVSTHFTVTSNVLTVTDQNRKWCIFPILPVNVFFSLPKIIMEPNHCTVTFNTESNKEMNTVENNLTFGKEYDMQTKFKYCRCTFISFGKFNYSFSKLRLHIY